MKDQPSSFLIAEIPRQFTVLGQRLQPFSLWHLTVLSRLENGFAGGRCAPDLGGLLQGVFFCCQSWEDGLAAMQCGGFEKQIAAWGREVGKQIPPEVFFKRNGLFEGSAELFVEYLKEGTVSPVLLPSDGEGRMPGTPLLHLLKLFLMTELRLSEPAAMNFPFAKACHLFFAWHEQKGSAKVANAEEREEIEAHEEAIESDEFLQKCLEALPGAKPIQYGAKEKRNRGASSLRKKKGGRECRSK